VERAFVGLSCTTDTLQLAKIHKFTRRFAWSTFEVKCEEAYEAAKACDIKAKEAKLEAYNGTNKARVNGEIATIRAATKANCLADAN